MVLSLLALGICIALAVTAYFTWNQLQRLADGQLRLESQIDKQTAPLRASVQDLSQDLERQRQALQVQTEKLGEEQASIGHRLSALATLVARGEQGWGLSEVEYLLRIANQRLLLQRDVVTAEVALSSADRRLRELADPLYTGVREEIASELEALGAVPDVDEAGIAASLGALLDLVDGLPVAGSTYQPATAAEGVGAEGESTSVDWRELPAVLWASLSELFRLREHDQPLEPMLPPERAYYLRENVRLQLVAARLALLRDDPTQYREALTTARGWLEAHFAQDSQSAAEAVSRLEALAALNIRPELPDISGSLRLLRQQMKLGERQAVPATAPPTSPDAETPAGDAQDAEQPPEASEP
jgi:uroporphyrin-3 C-methyltransferase